MDIHSYLRETLYKDIVVAATSGSRGKETLRKRWIGDIKDWIGLRLTTQQKVQETGISGENWSTVSSTLQQ